MPTDYESVGPWSEVKLAILDEYATAYTRILAANKLIRRFVYIDAFAGAGAHLSRTTNELIPGSPLKALHIQPPFDEYHLIDLDRDKAANLRELTRDLDNVFIYPEDCNRTLLKKVFPRVQYSDYHRGLCLLDPYSVCVDWEVIRTAGEMKSIEIFLNFMIMDMNMNMLKRDFAAVKPEQAERMTRFWGDDSWRAVAYQKDLFDYPLKNPNEVLAEAFRQRLKEVAGFAHVPQPIPMKNSKGAVVYYLYFASPKPVAANIVEDIFRKYRELGKR